MMKTYFFLILGCAGVVGCGGGSMAFPDRSPSITSIAPSSLPAGGGPFSLILTGTGLLIASKVHFGADVLSPSMAQPCAAGGNCQAIEVSVPAKDIATPGSVNVSVSNGGLNSNTVMFTIKPQIAGNSPQVLAFLPTVAPAGGSAFSMVIIGLNVAPGAVVNFGSLQITPNSILPCTPGELCPELLQVPASAIASAGQVPLSITNPGGNGGTSTALPFLVLASNTFPLEQSVNNANPSAPANANSTHSSVSAGAAFVAFDSTASNLSPSASGGLSQVFVRNNCFAGLPDCVPQTTLISSSSDGPPSGGGMQGSDKPVISLDGRFVAFESDDTNLVPGVTQAVEQIYLRDTCNTIFGVVPDCVPSTTLISASPEGASGNAPSLNATISAFGFFVAFQSTATNLKSTATLAGISQIYLSRQCPAIEAIGAIPGCTPSLALASFDANGNPGDKDSTRPSLDAIGLVLSFESLADNLVAATPGNGFQQIYAHNTCFSLSFPAITLPCPNVAEAVSVDSTGKLGTGDSVSPATGLLATAVAFATRAPNILPPNTSGQQVVGAATCVIEETLGLSCSTSPPTVVSLDQNGLSGRGDSSNPAISFQEIAFTSSASLLPSVSGQQVYLANTCVVSGGNCTSVSLLSADAARRPLGGDFVAMEPSGTFATFATKGSAASQGTEEVFLTSTFF